MKTRISTLLTLTAGLFVSGVAWGDVSGIVGDCNGCHGDGGVSQWADMPTIAGLPEFTQGDALYIYRDEARPCAESAYRAGDTSKAATTMCAVTSALSDDQIDELAIHYSSLDFVPAKQDFDAALAAAGKANHDEKCEKCHTGGGANPEDESSILAGQWMGYMETTFAQYAAGEREQPAAMKTAMDQLSDADVKALLNYYASQQ